jgi:hypothetical protein
LKAEEALSSLKNEQNTKEDHNFRRKTKTDRMRRSDKEEKKQIEEHAKLRPKQRKEAFNYFSGN